MRYAKAALFVVGVLAVALGIVWVGRGTGWYVWPADSFMAHQMTWAYRGAALAAIGVVLAFGSRRL